MGANPASPPSIQPPPIHQSINPSIQSPVGRASPRVALGDGFGHTEPGFVRRILMSLGRRQRKLLLAVGILMSGLLLIWFSMPLWFPWVLRPISSRYGASYARFERL